MEQVHAHLEKVSQMAKASQTPKGAQVLPPSKKATRAPGGWNPAKHLGSHRQAT